VGKGIEIRIFENGTCDVEWAGEGSKTVESNPACRRNCWKKAETKVLK
jgi:hypothetical protein